MRYRAHLRKPPNGYITEDLLGTDAEAEASILWPLDVNSGLIGKDPDAGKTEGRRRRGRRRMRCLNSITNSLDMNLSKLWETAEDRGLLCCRSTGSQRIGHDLVTEQQPGTRGSANLKTLSADSSLRYSHYPALQMRICFKITQSLIGEDLTPQSSSLCIRLPSISQIHKIFRLRLPQLSREHPMTAFC